MLGFLQMSVVCARLEFYAFHSCIYARFVFFLPHFWLVVLLFVFGILNLLHAFAFVYAVYTT